MKKLRLSDDLTLPLEAVTQTIAILAKRRAGKSFTARRLTEQLFRAGQQVCIVDPKGDWWGIRSAADGRSPGLPIVILGGEHADVPLEVGAGAVVAKLVAEERASVLLDLSGFRKGEVARFMGGPMPPHGKEEGFLEALYRLKAREQFRTPLMLMIDEADAIAPQRPQKGEERMLGAAEDIVRRGGQRGIGCTVITQRSAVLNKNVLTQAQILVALRTIAPQDLEALGAWIDVHGSPAERRTLMESLPALPTGDAWVWSPGWPTTDGIFQRIHVAPIETFDSGSTPGQIEKRVEPKNRADVDLDALRAQMADTIERAKADDPRELRRELAELRAELKKAAKAKAPAAPPPPKVETVEVPVLKEAQLKRLEAATARHEKAAAALAEAHREIAAALRNGHGKVTPPAPGRPAVPRPAAAAPRETAPRRQHQQASDTTTALGASRQKILDTLATLEGLGIDTPSRTQLALWCGVSSTSGGYFNNLGALRSAGLVAYPVPDTVALTAHGRALSAPPQPLTVEEMQAALYARVGGSRAAILRALIDLYPAAIGKSDLAEQLGVSPTSGGYFNNLGALRTLGLLDYPSPGQVAALPVLFLGEA